MSFFGKAFKENLASDSKFRSRFRILGTLIGFRSEGVMDRFDHLAAWQSLNEVATKKWLWLAAIGSLFDLD